MTLTLARHQALADLLARGEQVEAVQAQARAVGGCSAPVRLVGRADRLDRVTGEVVRVWSSEELPDGVQHVACKNRRASRCEACSRLYQDDAWHLIAAGLRGGKGVPESVAGHPALFVTLTAPSFGPVHTTRPGRDGKPGCCRPHSDAGVCEHGVPMACWVKHADDDPLLGQALCADCFDYAGAVLWNAHASELWRRTLIGLYRELARLLGSTEKQVRREVRVQYVKVAEYQRRGVVHFHVLARLDATPPSSAPWPDGVPWRLPYPYDPPPAHYTTDLLGQAVRGAAARARVPYPKARGEEAASWASKTQAAASAADLAGLPTKPKQGTQSGGGEAGQGPACEAGHNVTLDARPAHDRELRGPGRAPYPAHALDHDAQSDLLHERLPDVDPTPRCDAAVWGAQLDIRALVTDDVDTATHPHVLGRHQVAGYLAKYATKHTEALGPLDRRLQAADLALLPVNPHVHRLVVCTWLLQHRYRPAHDERRRDLKLDRWAHQLGYGGHFLTKSRRYSTTFTRLRAARAAWQHRHRLAVAAALDPWDRLADAARHTTTTAWRMTGVGWRLEGDALLARTALNDARHARQAAREAQHDQRLNEALAA